VSPVMLQAAERRVYLPQVGFTESFNVSVATALTLQRLLDMQPSYRGHMGEDERAQLRERWYTQLAPTHERRDEFKQFVHKGNRGEIHWTEKDLRPREEGRIPRVTPQQRRKMREAGQREVNMTKERPGNDDEQKQPT
jgi:hypothetical protein